MFYRKHPVQKIIDRHLRNGLTPPEFADIGGEPHHCSGMSWWVRITPKGAWSHFCIMGKREFVDGVEL